MKMSKSLLVARNASRGKRKPRLGWRRVLALFLIACGVLCVSIWGITWWDEQPIRTARSLLDADQPDDALKTIDDFLKDHRDHSAAVALKARALSRLGRAAEAVRLFDQVGAARRDEMKDCSHAYLTLGQWVQAREVLEYLVTLDTNDADRYHELAACRAKLGDYDGAVEAARIFASKPGKQARGYLLIGMLEMDRGNARKASEAWQKVLQVNSDATELQVTPEEFFAEFGAALQEIGEPVKAREMLERSIRIRETPRALSKLGSALNQLAKPDAAKVAWEKTLTHEPKNEIAVLGLAELAMRASDFSTAIAILRPVEESEQPSSAAAYLLSRVYGMDGNSELADVWKARFEKIRKHEELKRTVDQILIDNPSSMWGQVLQAYRLAEAGNMGQARILLAPHIKEGLHPFVAQLANALENESRLPSLDGLPLELFH